MHLKHVLRLPFLLCLLESAHAQDGGGPLPAAEARDELSSSQRARIDHMLIQNDAALRRSGRLSELPPTAPTQTGLHWPLRPVATYADPGYHGVANFVDLDSANANSLLDWNCGQRTYDGHAGDDLFLTPFPWIMMDHGDVDIVAAAPGTIIGSQDGFDDRSCPNNYSADWNAVYIEHADGRWLGTVT